LVHHQIEQLLGQSKRVRRRYILVLDSICLIVATYAGICAARSAVVLPNLAELASIGICLILVHLTFSVLKVYRAIIRHLDLLAVLRIAVAITLASAIWILLVNLLNPDQTEKPTLFLVQWIVSLVLIIGYRVAAKLFLEEPHVRIDNPTGVAIFGLNSHSRQFAREMKKSGNYTPSFFLVEDDSLSGGLVNNIRVYSLDMLDWAVTRFAPAVVVFCCSHEEFATKNKLVRRLVEMNLSVRLSTGAESVLEQGTLIDNTRPVELDDLIGRQPNPIQPELQTEAVRDQHILVTGAAGSIGSRLCQRIAELKPASLTMLDQNETDLIEVRNRIGNKSFPVKLCLGSVTDRHFIDRVFKVGGFTTVIHAAAYKHLSSGENYPESVIANNIDGTHNVILAADRANVSRFMLVSTDKSVEPSSVMGASKLWCEKLVSAYGAKGNGHNYASVRFGNVIESRGSVAPKFKRQIRSGGPITISDLRMKRYFMSTDEAVDLILQAIPMSKGGETFALKMGEPVEIREIARALVHRSGKTLKSPDNPNGEIELVESGRNDAEKLEEKLFADSETFNETRHPSILVSTAKAPAIRQINAMYRELNKAIDSGDQAQLKALLFDQLSRLGTKPKA